MRREVLDFIEQPKVTFGQLTVKQINQLPETYQQDLVQAMNILLKGGCTHVFLFGSLAHGQVNLTSDIDLAIQGCPKGQFFYLYGQLLRQLHHQVDLVNLDSLDPFGHYLAETGELYQLV